MLLDHRGHQTSGVTLQTRGKQWIKTGHQRYGHRTILAHPTRHSGSGPACRTNDPDFRPPAYLPNGRPAGGETGRARRYETAPPL